MQTYDVLLIAADADPESYEVIVATDERAGDLALAMLARSGRHTTVEVRKAGQPLFVFGRAVSEGADAKAPLAGENSMT